jgi:hypothetical protein
MRAAAQAKPHLQRSILSDGTRAREVIVIELRLRRRGFVEGGDSKSRDWEFKHRSLHEFFKPLNLKISLTLKNYM